MDNRRMCINGSSSDETLQAHLYEAMPAPHIPKILILPILLSGNASRWSMPTSDSRRRPRSDRSTWRYCHALPAWCWIIRFTGRNSSA